MITLEQVAGWSAIIAAAATVIGAVTLTVFFQKGNPWGTWNDIASVVLMLATIPVAVVVAAIEREQFATLAIAAAAIGIVAMLVAATLQAALVLGLRTYEQVTRRVLAAGGFVGLWYVLAGLLALARGLEAWLAWLALASGVGFMAVAYGFAVGGERNPLAVIGGIVLLIASTGFLAGIGWQLASGRLVIPTWNA